LNWVLREGQNVFVVQVKVQNEIHQNRVMASVGSAVAHAAVVGTSTRRRVCVRCQPGANTFGWDLAHLKMQAAQLKVRGSPDDSLGT